jgi:hypothetical protein
MSFKTWMRGASPRKGRLETLRFRNLRPRELPRRSTGQPWVEPDDLYESWPGSGRRRALRGCSRCNVDHRASPVMTSLGGCGDFAGKRLRVAH